MKPTLTYLVIALGTLTMSCTSNLFKGDRVLYDSKGRFTCAGYSLIDYGIDHDAPVEFYYANTDKLVCTFEMLARICAPTEPGCSCPPKKWADSCWGTFDKFLKEQREARRRRAEALGKRLKQTQEHTQ